MSPANKFISITYFLILSAIKQHFYTITVCNLKIHEIQRRDRIKVRVRVKFRVRA